MPFLVSENAQNLVFLKHTLEIITFKRTQRFSTELRKNPHCISL